MKTTIMPAMSGARKNRDSSPTTLTPRTGTVSAHQISAATKNEP